LNRPKLLAVTGHDPQFVTALAVAAHAVAGELRDPTGGADSYFAAGTPRPAWATTARFTKQIGHHLFYRTRPDADADALNAAQLAHLAPQTD
jgi:hypothetical protein